MTHYIPDGTTEAQEFQIELKDEAGTVTNLDLTGAILSLSMWDRLDRPITVSGTVQITTANEGKWSYTPDGQLVRALSPYRYRLTVDQSGVVKVPNGKDRDEFIVVA